MKIDIASPDKYVEQNKLPEVVNGNMFSRQSSAPDEQGLVSYEIFGNPGTKQRKMQFAYIDLGDIFVHPMVMDNLTMLKKIIKNVIEGKELFYIRNGQVYKYESGKTKIDEKQFDIGTGVHWLKKHYKEIDFNKENTSAKVKERIKFMQSLSMDEIFISKWLVMPAYYRDVNMDTMRKNDINIMYQSLISQTNVVKSTKKMFTHGETTDSHRLIQNKLCEMYRYFTSFIGGTKSFVQLHAIGKAVDYSARMVISTARVNAISPKMMDVDYSHSAVPLSMVLECFAPFIHYGIKEFVKSQINGSDYIYTKDKAGNLVRIPLASHWEQCLLRENIQKLIKTYTDSKEHRLDYFTVEAEDGSQIPLGYVIDDSSVSSSDKETVIKGTRVRPITLCEMFYMIAMDYCGNKGVMITRYPLEDYQNIYPSLMNIMPYEKTKVAVVNGKSYPRFPDISEDDILHKTEEKVLLKYNDTLHLFPTYLPALGADFDGDTVTVQGIFGKYDVNKYVHSNMNIINIAGGSMRNISDVNSQVVYALTRTLKDV